MGLSCSCPGGDSEEWYFHPESYSTMPVIGRRKKCCSCGRTINGAETVAWFPRYRNPQSEIEERIRGDEILMAPAVMCEACADLFFSLTDLGYCVGLFDDMRELAAEYAATKSHEAAERANRRYIATEKLWGGCLDSGLL